MVENDTSRKCGECSLCCFTHRVKGPDRRVLTDANEWCEFCEVGHGCAIYETRPWGCRGFRCAWLEGTGSDEERPDKTNVVLEWRPTYFGKTLVMAGSIPGALESDYARKITLEHVKCRIPVVHVHVNKRDEFIFLKGAAIDDSSRRCVEAEGIGITFIDAE